MTNNEITGKTCGKSKIGGTLDPPTPPERPHRVIFQMICIIGFHGNKLFLILDITYEIMEC